jgi:hypothetical protein
LIFLSLFASSPVFSPFSFKLRGLKLALDAQIMLVIHSSRRIFYSSSCKKPAFWTRDFPREWFKPLMIEIVKAKEGEK